MALAMVLFREYLASVTPEHDATRLRRSKRRDESGCNRR